MFYIFTLLLILPQSFYAATAPPKSEFIVSTAKPKKCSRNELKERLGSAAKKLIDQTIQLIRKIGSIQLGLGATPPSKKITPPPSVAVYQQCHRHVGNVQIHLASVQKTCSQLVEKLIDDDELFQTTATAKLQSTLETLQHTTTALQAFNSLSTLASHDVLLAQLGKHEQALAQATKTMAADGCLKQL